MQLLTDIAFLHTVAASDELFLQKEALQGAPVIEDAWLLIKDGKVNALGKMDELPTGAFPDVPNMDCTGRTVVPGFIDSHTHLVFPKSREVEYVDRIKGLSYEEIARRGGGILNSARATASMSEEQLLEDAKMRADEILSLGTTTVEIKSGYGLSVESELKLLRVANELKNHTPLRIKTTFLGAHAIPLEYKDRRKEYIDLVCNVMLPQVMEEGLADFIDVFCDEGFFTPEETLYILDKGKQVGLPGKIHANELAVSGGVQAGIEAGAYSVDHLEHLSEVEISLLAEHDTVACVLPTVAYFLGIPYAPARELVDEGAIVALATDYNPGSSPGGSMPFVMSLACNRQRLLPEEALAASTLNAAFALRMSDMTGALTPGRAADLIICKPGIQLAHIPYYYAANPVDKVMIDGKFVV
ncbi:MAG: imidazolonepropionase [Bacteroidia bacterium]